MSCRSDRDVNRVRIAYGLRLWQYCCSVEICHSGCGGHSLLTEATKTNGESRQGLQVFCEKIWSLFHFPRF